MSRVSLYQQFAARWRRGCGSEACSRPNTRVCLARGTVPCDVLFVGEAPGESENVLGRPFVGPAGKLLDAIIAQAVPAGVTYALTNLVGCIPREEDGGKAKEPFHEDVLCCGERLREFVELCSPRLVVCVGKLARDWLSSGLRDSFGWAESYRRVHVTHPAAILRATEAARELEVRRCVVTISNAVAEL